MRNYIQNLLVSAGLLLALSSLAAPSITGVTAKQRFPWNGKVDISFTVSGDVAEGLPDGALPVLSVTAEDRENGSNYVADSFSLTREQCS